MGACEQFAQLSSTSRDAPDRGERWRQIVNAYSQCYPSIVAEVLDNPDRAKKRAEELVRFANGYGFEVSNAQFDALISETVNQLAAQKLKKENPSRDPTQKRVMKGADPVMMFNGQFAHDAQDLTVDGAGIRFEFIRNYRNQSQFAGPLGFNWDHNYNLWLRVSGDNVFRATGGLGTESFLRHPRFGDPGFTYWTPPDGQHAVLIEQGDSFLCRFPNGDRHLYQRDQEHPFLHRVTRIQDKHGNYLRLSYADGRLTEVEVNHPARIVRFEYDGEDRITAIADYTGRRWLYRYDFFGDLIAVTAPQGQCGATVRYEYSSSQFTGELQHNLIRIFDAEGRFYLENEYGQESGLLRFNRVVRQRLGGGDFFFDYEDFEDPLDFDYGEHEKPAHITTLIDRNGQTLRHVYNAFGNIIRKEQWVCSRGRARLLVSRYRYNRDGSLVAVLTPEGVLTQSLFGRDAFVRRFGAAEDASLRLHPELTIESRQSFGHLLATVQRAAYLDFAALDFSRGEWGDSFPDILAEPAPDDIVRKLTYEPVYGQLAAVSDPRFTSSADPGRQSAPLEHPRYEETLTRYFYRGPDPDPSVDPTLLLDRIVRPRAADPDGTPGPEVVERFTRYDERGRLLTHIDPIGARTEYLRFAENELSTDGQPTIQGHVKLIVTDAGGIANRSAYQVDALGRVTFESLPRSAEPQGSQFIVRRAYDEQDRVTRMTGPGPFRFETRSFYDGTGMLVREERDALDETGRPFAGGVHVRAFEYDSELHLITESYGGAGAEARLVTRHCFDAAGRLASTVSPDRSRTRIDYDERSLPVAETRGAGTPDAAVTRTEYDGDGRVVRKITARGHVTLFTLDPFGRVIAEEDPLGNVTRRTFDKNGKVLVERLFERRPDGSYRLAARTESQFDELGRRHRAGINLFTGHLPAANLADDYLASPGPGRLLVSQNFYDANNRTRRVVDPLLRAHEFDHDGLGRVTAEREPLGSFAANRYNRHGSLLRRDVTDAMVDPETGIPRQRVLSWAYQYDTLDRRSSETDGLGNLTRYGFDSLGNFTSREDALGNRLRNQYDIHGRKIASIMERTEGGVGGGTPLPAAVTRYEYDPNGRVVTITDALGRSTRQTYDALGRRRSITHPDASRWSYEYDPDSNPIRIQDADGLIRRMTMDPMGRLVQVTVDASELKPGIELGGTTTESFGYDALGRRLRAENDFVITLFQHNSAGYALRETMTFKAPQPGGLDTFTVEREFSDVGELVELTYPGRRVVRFHRDDLERMVRIENVAKGLDFPGGSSIPEVHDVATFAFAGRQSLQTAYGNGSAIRQRHDRLGRVIEILHSAGGAPLLRSQQLYDAAGNLRLRNEADSTGQRGEFFQFDSQRRLARIELDAAGSPFDPAPLEPPAAPEDPIPDGQSAIHAMIGPLALLPGTETILYDLAGNRVSEKPEAGPPILYTVNALDQYTSRGAETFSYDPNGNLIAAGSRGHRYDHFGRLVAVSGPGVEAQFEHDGLGRRVLERRPGTTTLLVYDRDNVIAEYRDGALFAQYVHASGLDRPVQSAVRGVPADGAVFWLHADATGSIRLLTDESAVVAASYRYRPFGETIAETPGAPYNPFRFAGRRLDPDSGTYDFRARQYDPRLGRFLQRDPLGIQTDPNLYSYAGNNPLVFTDPLGTSRKDRQAQEAGARKDPTPPPDPPPAKVADAPKPDPGKPLPANPEPHGIWTGEWARPDLKKYLPENYDEVMQAKREERGKLWSANFQWEIKRNEAINLQKEARERLDEIRRNDIWPNWGTLNHALTAVGTLWGLYSGEILIPLATGALSLWDTDSGAGASAVTSCVPKPLSANCGAAIVNGAASIYADRKDQQVTAVRRSAKDEANLMLDNGRKAQAAAEKRMSDLKHQMDLLDDDILFIEKMHDFAKYGWPGDNPMYQRYKVPGVLL